MCLDITISLSQPDTHETLKFPLQHFGHQHDYFLFRWEITSSSNLLHDPRIPGSRLLYRSGTFAVSQWLRLRRSQGLRRN